MKWRVPWRKRPHKLPTNELPNEVLALRIHNNVLDYFQLMASPDAQLEYQRDVPDVPVICELVNMWYDCVHGPDAVASDPVYGAPGFNEDERAAMLSYEKVMQRFNEAVEANAPIAAVQRTEEFAELRDAAEQCLKVFQVRGRLPED